MSTIYTWRNLEIVGEAASHIEIRWDWDDWDHAANDRQHVLEAEHLWRLVYPGNVIEPIINALRKKALNDCHADLQRLAGLWDEEIRRVFGIPRILKILAFPKDNPRSQGTAVVSFATKEGIFFTARRIINQRYKLRTFYFAECLVNGFAAFPQMFERNAVEHYADMYSRRSHGRLPSQSNPKHCVVRKWEIDRQIQFVNAVHWGFESERLGAKWIGFDGPSEPAGTLGEVDPPPPTRSHTEDEVE